MQPWIFREKLHRKLLSWMARLQHDQIISEGTRRKHSHVRANVPSVQLGRESRSSASTSAKFLQLKRFGWWCFTLGFWFCLQLVQNFACLRHRFTDSIVELREVFDHKAPFADRLLLGTHILATAYGSAIKGSGNSLVGSLFQSSITIASNAQQGSKSVLTNRLC